MIYFDNAYRILGLFDHATRNEVRNLAHQLRIRSRVSGDAPPPDPLAVLAPANRTEDTIRDAFNALANVEQRLRERLCWFTNANSRDTYALSCVTAGDFKGAVEAWGSDTDPASRANLARLYHVLMIVRFIFPAPAAGAPEIPAAYTWNDAFKTWKDVLANDMFWEQFGAIERASGFEPPAFGADIASLRTHAWETLLDPSLLLLGTCIKGKEYGRARDHLEDLRDAGLPPRTITDLEKDAFAPVAVEVDAAIDEITVQLNDSVRGGIKAVTYAYERYRKEAIPVLNGMLKLAGYNFEPSRQLCETCCEFVRLLAQKASNTGSTEYANALQGEANALLKGIVESEKRLGTPAATSTSGYRPTGTPRETKSRGGISGWTIVKAMLLLIGVVARIGACESTDHTDYPTSLYSSRYPSLSTASLDSADLTTFDSISVADLTTNVKLREVLQAERNLERGGNSLSSQTAALDEDYERTNYLDSEAVALGTADTVMRNVARRAMKLWLKRYRDKWSDFESAYKDYATGVASFNRDLRKLPRSVSEDERPSKMTVDEDLQSAYAKHRQAIAKWKKIE